jgi:preprotein translocase subunit SecE
MKWSNFDKEQQDSILVVSMIIILFGFICFLGFIMSRIGSFGG